MERYFAIGIIGIFFLQCSLTVCAQQMDLVENDTVKKIPFLKKAIVPASLIIYGLGSLQGNSLRQFDHYINGTVIGRHSYSGIADDYLRYAPVGVAYGLDLIGVKSRNNFIDRTAMLLISISLTSTSVTLTKKGVGRQRPDGSSFTSFPSSHAAMAFMSAEFMNQEYKDESGWYGVAGYAMATATGLLRLYHHVHWFSDILMGAGYGILSTKLAYFIYPYFKRIIIPKQALKVLVVPSFQKGYTGLSVNYSFD